MNDVEVEIQKPLVELDETELVRNLRGATEENKRTGKKRILEQLRLLSS
jgi:hypothetical protein